MSSSTYSSYTISAKERQRLAEEARRRAEEERRRRQAEEERRRREEEAEQRRRIQGLIEATRRLEERGREAPPATGRAGASSAPDAPGRHLRQAAQADAAGPAPEAVLASVKQVLGGIPADLQPVMEPDLSTIRASVAEIEAGRGPDFNMQRQRLLYCQRTLQILLAKAPGRLESVVAARAEAAALEVELDTLAAETAPGTNDGGVADRARQLRAEIARAREGKAALALVEALPDLKARVRALWDARVAAHGRSLEREFVTGALSETLREMGYEPCELPDDPPPRQDRRVLSFRTPHGQAVRLTVDDDASLDAEFVIAPGREGESGDLTESALIGQCGRWCHDMDELVTRSARKGLLLSVRNRIPPERGAFLEMAVPDGESTGPTAPQARRQRHKASDQRQSHKKPKERHVE